MTQRKGEPDHFVVPVRVKPGASRPRVGGSHGSALVVAVTARAVEGRATRAVLDAVAEAFGVRPSRATLLAGRTSRDKLIALSPAPPDAASRLAALRAD
ncbi:DUF167 domain-containing protein [Cryptosporangium arvum]|uniref:DUF167 domain-containing protein n=1 Tax=Cryptosporangium arvum TaxID=80871 RepID=UPI000688926D|nr:DUF167 domain-containing protein [Cryptosporangium arvum]